MKLVKCEKIDGLYSKTKNLLILEEFMNSDMDCAKVEDYPNNSAKSCASSLSSSIKRFGFGSIRVSLNNGVVYLIKQ